MALATFTKSVREAQSYLSFVMLIPFLPGFFLGFASVRPDLTLMLTRHLGSNSCSTRRYVVKRSIPCTC
jgi:ABC-type Na+ efflux pump permease subunit